MKNTQKVKNLLMRADLGKSAKMMDLLNNSSETKPGENENNETGANMANILQDSTKVNERAAETIKDMRISSTKPRKRNPRKCFSETRIREISSQRWGQKGWTPSNSDCLEANIDPLFTVINQNISIAGKTLRKAETSEDSQTISHKESLFRLSITDQLLKKYRHKSRSQGSPESRILKTPTKPREFTSSALPATANNSNIYDIIAGFSDGKRNSITASQFYFNTPSRGAKRGGFIPIAQSMNISAQESMSCSPKNTVSNDPARRKPQCFTFNNTCSHIESKTASVLSMTPNKPRDSAKTEPPKNPTYNQKLSIGQQADSEMSQENPLQLNFVPSIDSTDVEGKVVALTSHSMFSGKKLILRSGSSEVGRRNSGRVSPMGMKLKDKLVEFRQSIDVKRASGRRESSFEHKSTRQPVRVQSMANVVQNQSLFYEPKSLERTEKSSVANDLEEIVPNTRKLPADMDENVTNFVLRTVQTRDMDRIKVTDFRYSKGRQVAFDGSRRGAQQGHKLGFGMKKLNLKNILASGPVKIFQNE